MSTSPALQATQEPRPRHETKAAHGSVAGVLSSKRLTFQGELALNSLWNSVMSYDLEFELLDEEAEVEEEGAAIKGHCLRVFLEDVDALEACILFRGVPS